MSVTLPNRHQLHFRATGKVMRVREVPDGQCFLHNGQVWEKLPGSCGNLSDFDDDGEVLPWVRVELLATSPKPAA